MPIYQPILNYDQNVTVLKMTIIQALYSIYVFITNITCHFQDLIRHQLTTMPSSLLSDPVITKKVVLDGDEFDRPHFPMPDTSQMLPYKPRPNAGK